MLLVVTLAAVYLANNIASAATVPNNEKVYYDLEDADNLYKEYLKLHNKHYNTEEYRKRLEIFKESLKEINAMNEISWQTVFGPTVFSDLTPEERRSRIGFPPLNNNTELVSLPLNPGAVYEDSLDWRARGMVSPIKDQAACGSCYIFSAVGDIEGKYAMRHGQCLALSEQQLLDCTKNLGCDGGWPHEVMNQAAGDSSALESEADYPYTAVPGQCREDASRKQVTVQGGQQLNVPDEETLKQYLAEYGPLAIVIDSADLQKYTSDILHPQACANNLDHAVLLVGYGEEAGTPFWIIKNSWGTVWGEQGYLRLVRGTKACGISTYVASSTVA